MKRYLYACAVAGVFAAGASVAAQPPANPQMPSAAQETQDKMATVEGCLVREQDVPGRQPNVAENAGVMEDYILTNAKVVKGSPPATQPQPQAEAPTGTSGTLSPMYDVEGIDDELLKSFVGKRVQIDGTFSDLERDPSEGPTEDLINIDGKTIRAASGECPQK